MKRRDSSVKTRGRAPPRKDLGELVMPPQLAAHNEVILEVGAVQSKWRHRLTRSGLNALKAAGAGFDNDLPRVPRF